MLCITARVNVDTKENQDERRTTLCNTRRFRPKRRRPQEDRLCLRYLEDVGRTDAEREGLVGAGVR